MAYRALSAKVLAGSISTIEYKILKAVQINELDNAAWVKPEKETTSPNIVKFLKFSNQLTYWIVSEVLSIKHTPERANLIVYFLDVGEELLSSQDFNGASLVVLALRHPSISRLKATWTLVPDKSQAILQRLYDYFLIGLDTPENDYELYRKTLKSVNPPFIPFMRLLLEEVADACTDPADPTISTRHYKCRVQNMRIYGMRDELATMAHVATKLLVENKQLLEDAKAVHFVAQGTTRMDLEGYILNYKVLENDLTYEISRALQPRPANQEDSSTIIWIGIGGALVVAGFAVFYVYQRKNS